MGADVLAKVERRWPRRRHELGACLVWTGPQVKDRYGNVYGRLYDAAIGRTDYTHRVVWRRVHGPIPLDGSGRPLPLDHLCEITLCQRPDHLEAVTRAENTRRRHQRAKTIDRTAQTAGAVQRFAVALFAGIDRPKVQRKTLALDELVAMLSRFEVLADKRRGRCWSPTRYADGTASRGNAGVDSVSCLVFDLDRVPPDPDRLAGVCWIGHTTWSHRPSAPRWRVTVPLDAPVPTKNWVGVWRRARAALCPEADPSCKDPSRQYYLPTCPAGVAPESAYHPGPLLDARTLPAFPPEEREIERRASPMRSRKTIANDQRRGEAYMESVIESLATTAPGGRNAALNRAAWTLGRWIAAGALDQAAVEDALYAAAERNGLTSDDGQRQCWATIRSGISAGLQQPIDLNAERD